VGYNERKKAPQTGRCSLAFIAEGLFERVAQHDGFVAIRPG
jgi:hypothetical protein